MGLKIAYLCGEYPRVTDTFIQREVKALRKAGISIETISVRMPKTGERGTYEQIKERERTHYLLPISVFRLFYEHLKLFFLDPIRYMKALHFAVIVRSPGIRSLVYQIFYFAEAGVLVLLMRKHGLRHIHNHTPNSSGYVAMIAQKLSSITYSMTLHGFGILSEPKRWNLQEKLEKSLFTICVSHHARSQAMLWSNRDHWEKYYVVHCGINVDMRKNRKHSGHAKNLLFIGRFDQVKALPILIDSFELLSKKYKDIHLDLVGDGPTREDIETLVREKELIDRVSFHGYLSQAEIKDIILRSDLFVITSFVEGIPVVLMEAMSYGIPVVAPCINGIPELVQSGKNGLLSISGDVRSFTQNIEILIENDKMRNLFAEKGMDTVRREFNIETGMKRLTEIFTEKLLIETHKDE